MSDLDKLRRLALAHPFLVLEAVLDHCKTDMQSTDPKTRAKARAVLINLAAEIAALEGERQALARTRRRRNPPTKKPAQ